MPLGNIGGAMGAPGQLGQAQGKLVIDTSSLSAAAGTARTFGNQIEQSIGRAGSGIRGFGNDIRAMRRELLAVGVAAGGITFFGLQSARNLRNYRIQFTQLLGDVQAADAVMADLTRGANEFGIAVTEVWQLGRALLPVLEGGSDELDTWVKRAALIASTNPLKGTADAARAIQEYLAGQTISLQRLFNVPPELIQEAQDRFEDVGDQLDYILERMGATEEGARQMADAWVSVKNELQLVLATGFTPLLNTLQPILRGLAEFLAHLRATSPGLLTFGSGLIGVVAVGAPLLLFLEQLITLLQKVKTLSVTAMLGRVGVGAAALAVGAGIGVEGVQAVGRATENERLAEFGIGDAAQTLRQWLLVVVDGLTKFAAILGGIVTQVQQRFVNAIFTMIQAIGNFVQFVGSILQRAGDIIPDFLGGDKLAEFGDSLIEAGEGVNDWVNTTRDTVNMSFQETRDGILQWQQDITAAAARFLGFMPTRAEEAPAGRAARGAEPVERYTEEQREAMADWYSELRRIEASANEQRIQETIQYEDQRTQVIAAYELQIAREAEDFARQRAREEQQLQRDIAAIRAGAIEREAEWQAELDKTIVSLKQESAERIEQIENDINRRREQLQREHRLTLMEAAARLDAQAVATEQRRFQEQNRQLDQELDERTSAEQENLEERIEQEEEAHQERLDKAREADEERIRDMEEAQRERQRMEDEDRRIRLQRQEDDHNNQLRQMDRFHAERQYRITSQETRERIQQDYAFRNRLIALNFHNQAWLAAQEIFQQASIDRFESYFATILSMQPSSINEDARPGGIGHQRGGLVDYTGMAMLHGSRNRPEYVLNPDTTAALRSMIGGFTQPGLVAAVAGGGGGGGGGWSGPRVSVGEFSPTIVLGDIGGRSDAHILRLFEQAMLDVFKELDGGL